MNSTFGVIGPTRATGSPWTPLLVVGPNYGGLLHHISRYSLLRMPSEDVLHLIFRVMVP